VGARSVGISSWTLVLPSLCPLLWYLGSTTPQPSTEAARRPSAPVRPDVAVQLHCDPPNRDSFSMFERELMQSEVPLFGEALVNKRLKSATTKIGNRFGGTNMDAVSGSRIPASLAEAVEQAVGPELHLVNQIKVPISSEGRSSVFEHLVGGRRVVAVNLLSEALRPMLHDVGFPGAPCSKLNCPGHGSTVDDWYNAKGSYR
jgi:hypothetical protein